METLRCLIVGSGPAACYVADALIKSDTSVSIDMLEGRPLPFGLLRNGVAPDHFKIKNLQSYFERILSASEIRYFGNVSFGSDISLSDVSSGYHAIFFCTGTQQDRPHACIDYSSPQCSGSRDVCAWYNGFQHSSAFSPEHLGSSVSILGIGNVALDIARIFLKSESALRNTEIPDSCIQLLSQQNIQDVHIFARRGPAQATCTPFELEELLSLENTEININPNDLHLSAIDTEEIQNSKPAAKNIDLFQQAYERSQALSQNTFQKTLSFHFYSAVTTIEPSQDDSLHVSIARTILSGPAYQQKANTTENSSSHSTCSLISSIGYLGLPLKDVAFDSTHHCIPHEEGRIKMNIPDNHAWLYAAGWIKRGPQGVIGTNKRDAKESVDSCLVDLKQRQLQRIDFDLASFLNTKQHRFISKSEVNQLFEHEIKNGSQLEKPRLKLTELDSILDCLNT
ncbi:hypothetical protein OAJ27_00995 [bacterium]|nr:hypothetical protein [bacterium]